MAIATVAASTTKVPAAVVAGKERLRLRGIIIVSPFVNHALIAKIVWKKVPRIGRLREHGDDIQIAVSTGNAQETPGLS
jgi:hypothetical protein